MQISIQKRMLEMSIQICISIKHTLGWYTTTVAQIFSHHPTAYLGVKIVTGWISVSAGGPGVEVGTP